MLIAGSLEYLVQEAIAGLRSRDRPKHTRAVVGTLPSAIQLKVAGYRAREVKECGLKASSVFELRELKATPIPSSLSIMLFMTSVRGDVGSAATSPT